MYFTHHHPQRQAINNQLKIIRHIKPQKNYTLRTVSQARLATSRDCVKF